MTTLSNFDPWLIQYDQDVTNPVRRTANVGRKTQRKNSHRETVIAKASRILVGSQVGYIEYFIREIADGRKFTDFYADGSGTQQGEIRIIGGYQISARAGYFVIECEIEVFR